MGRVEYGFDGNRICCENSRRNMQYHYKDYSFLERVLPPVCLLTFLQHCEHTGLCEKARAWIISLGKITFKSRIRDKCFQELESSPILLLNKHFYFQSFFSIVTSLRTRSQKLGEMLNKYYS